ncbi:DUF2974 domain-containing protein [Permianibacter sp. IMCC34836]|uniref:lipase family protein n=1 Tax=Permianibacter fluminis TaxID=2738515 RepID=UPI001551F824|nr:DUF2974 domain-containing protein [Permianibacter fluminis]NQD36387.1 DUF2974 domain-containing protein [Permianibacter fluminis]
MIWRFVVAALGWVPALLLALGVVSLPARASIRGCDPGYLQAAYGEPHRLAAVEGAIYALLANNAYDDREQPQFALPGDWQLASRTAEGDLQYSLFEQHRDGVIVKVVIAFRGTDSERDWWTGNIIGEQYEQAAQIVRSVQQRYPGTALIATGHSLGGGLALHVSMRFAGVSAYAFNPSPLVRQPETIARNRRVIYWEADDVLHWARWAWQKTPGAVYWRFSFVRGNGHNALVLAKGLLMLGALMNPDLANTLQQNCQINPLQD